MNYLMFYLTPLYDVSLKANPHQLINLQLLVTKCYLFINPTPFDSPHRHEQYHYTSSRYTPHLGGYSHDGQDCRHPSKSSASERSSGLNNYIKFVQFNMNSLHKLN